MKKCRFEQKPETGTAVRIVTGSYSGRTGKVAEMEMIRPSSPYLAVALDSRTPKPFSAERAIVVCHWKKDLEDPTGERA